MQKQNLTRTHIGYLWTRTYNGAPTMQKKRQMEGQEVSKSGEAPISTKEVSKLESESRMIEQLYSTHTIPCSGIKWQYYVDSY